MAARSGGFPGLLQSGRPGPFHKGCRIISPTVVFGEGDLPLNNMRWALLRFTVFPVFEPGDYPVQPVYAEGLAVPAVSAGSLKDSVVANAAGLDTFTFEELPRMLASSVGASQAGECTAVAGLCHNPACWAVIARHGARPQRGWRPDGGLDRICRTGERRNQAGRLARRQPGRFGPPVRARAAPQLQALIDW